MSAIDIYAALDARTLEILERRRTYNIRRRGWMVRRSLLAADLIGLGLAFVLAQQLYRAKTGSTNSFSDLAELGLFAASLPAWVVAAKVYGLYERDEERTDHSTADDLVGVFHLVTVCSWGLIALIYVTRLAHPVLPKLLLFWVLAVVFVTMGRAVARTVCRRSLGYLQNTVIVGAGETGQSLALKLLKHREYGLNLVGFIDANPRERSEALAHLTLLGDLPDLPYVVDLLDVERVIVAFTGDPHRDLITAIDGIRTSDVQIDIVPRLFENLGPSISVHEIEGIPLISLPPVKLSRSSLLVKRSLDLLIAGTALVVALPLLALLVVAVKADSRGPVLYRHRRVGCRGKSIDLLKFRTMYFEACRGDSYGGQTAERMFDDLMADPSNKDEFELTFKLRDDPRVTRLGRLLRRSSLDELPQLLNVLRGDLSLVGPRALTGHELRLYYGPDAETLLRTRPGITGYWQVNGRSQLHYSDRVRLDLAYIGGWSVGLDLRILAKTLRALFRPQSAF